MLLDKRILFVGGKGGVGKSTSAAAIALLHARNKKKTLLISTDPAHNIGDIFHKKLKNKPTKIVDYLDAIEIDPEAESKQYIQSVKDNIRGVVKPTMKDEVNRQIDAASSSPGAEEAALFDRMVSIILDEGEAYDTIIFDTAPTGHTIRLLTLPELMSVWINGMLERRKKRNDNYTQLLNDGEPVDDPIFQVLQRRKERFSSVREYLLDQRKTGYVFVLNPERLPILETARAIKELNKHDIEVNTIIINKVLSEDVDGEFWRKRKEVEKEYVVQIEDEFNRQRRHYIPLFETDISSLALLEDYADYLSDSVAEVVK
ncbi:ArsA family ATPase [Bacillus suaedaesalsae]|uniref:ArsA family ATPase n=1 Tax=Bacillus suaedaesalsae TaxID=2810349 RepID=A0ABS2DI34_9BACI|nr:ArsA family ATPase [Bacillus suaedaesalsae]MBM6618154.1 ArsA family ATPase [Bacillus suaedaesalsae]